MAWFPRGTVSTTMIMDAFARFTTRGAIIRFDIDPGRISIVVSQHERKLLAVVAGWFLSMRQSFRNHKNGSSLISLDISSFFILGLL